MFIIVIIIIIIIIDVYTIHWDFWLDLPEFCINIDIFFFMNILLKFTVQQCNIFYLHFNKNFITLDLKMKTFQAERISC